MLLTDDSAIVRNSTSAEDDGIHVHAWNFDGGQLDLDHLRALAVQRALAHETPILSLPCWSCGTSLLSPTAGWIEPTTTHVCTACGATTKTRRRVFLNPLADK